MFRARVAALPPGDVVLPAVSEGSGAWSRMVPIAYQTFGSGPDLLLISGQDGTMSWWDPAAVVGSLQPLHRDRVRPSRSGVLRACDEPTFAPVAGGHDRWVCPHHRAVRSDRARLGSRRRDRPVPCGASSGDRVLARSRRHLGRRCRCVASYSAGRAAARDAGRHTLGAIEASVPGNGSRIAGASAVAGATSFRGPLIG